jgi:hypothetical protein
VVEVRADPVCEVPVDSVEEVDVVGRVVVVVELVAGTTDTGTGTCVAGDDRTTRYRLPRPTNATSISAVDQRMGKRRWIGRRSAFHRDRSLTARGSFPR